MDGTISESRLFDQPVMSEIHYADGNVIGINESTLTLDHWDGSAWVDAACNLYDCHPEEEWFSVPICHLSRFSAFGSPYRAQLPLTTR